MVVVVVAAETATKAYKDLGTRIRVERDIRAKTLQLLVMETQVETE